MRIKKIFIFVLLMLVLPVMVNADMGAPMITEYEVVISNVDGAIGYDYDLNKKITEFDYDAKLTVVMESDGYVGVYYGDNNDMAFIKNSDVKLLEDKVTTKGFEKHDTEKLYVYGDDCYLYDGPSKNFGKVEGEVKIPKGTTITYEYSDEMWAYVTYKGVSGWIYYYSYKEMSPYKELSSVARVTDGKAIVVNSSLKLYNEPDIGTKFVSVNIPTNTILEYKYEYSTYPKIVFVYVTYEGVSGWLLCNGYPSDAIVYGDYHPDYLVFKDTVMYDYPSSTKGKKVQNLPIGVEVKTNYQYTVEIGDMAIDGTSETYIYVQYNGKKGWVELGSLATKVYSDVAYLVKATDGIKAYKNLDGTGEQIVIPFGTELRDCYDSFSDDDSLLFVKYEGNIYRLDNVEDLELLYCNEDGKCSSDDYIIYEKEEEFNDSDIDNELDVEDDTEEEKVSLTPMQLAMMGILVAVVVAVTSVVVMLLINKNKKIKEKTNKKQ